MRHITIGEIAKIKKTIASCEKVEHCLVTKRWVEGVVRDNSYWRLVLTDMIYKRMDELASGRINYKNAFCN